MKHRRTELLDLLEQKKTVREMAEAMGIAEQTVRNYLNREGLKCYSPFKELRKQKFTPEQQSIVVGTVLGDGYLSKGYPNVHLNLEHGHKQLEYLKWKWQRLQPFTYGSIYEIPKEGNNTYAFASIRHPFLGEMRRLIYSSNGVKRLSDEVLSRVDLLALAVWYGDDGSYTSRGGMRSKQVRKRIVQWYIDGSVSEEDVQRFSNRLKEQFHCPNSIYKHTPRNVWLVSLSIKASRSLLLSFAEIGLPDCLSYKLDLTLEESC